MIHGGLDWERLEGGAEGYKVLIQQRKARQRPRQVTPTQRSAVRDRQPLQCSSPRMYSYLSDKGPSKRGCVLIMKETTCFRTKTTRKPYTSPSSDALLGEYP